MKKLHLARKKRPLPEEDESLYLSQVGTGMAEEGPKHGKITTMKKA